MVSIGTNGLISLEVGSHQILMLKHFDSSCNEETQKEKKLNGVNISKEPLSSSSGFTSGRKRPKVRGERGEK